MSYGYRRHRVPQSWLAVVLGLQPQDFYGPGLPAAPTEALPGTADKVEVMAARYERRERLFHAGDARLPARAGFTPRPLPGSEEFERAELLLEAAGGKLRRVS